MATGHSKEADETQIRRLIEDRPHAVRAKDSNRLLFNHAADMLLFDVVNPLQYAGAAKARKRAEEWFALYRGPIGYEVRDLTIATGEDVAFCHYLYRASGTRTDGVKVDMWVRATVCFQQINGTWTVTHEHQSVPFDPETGKASLDLKP